MRKRWILGDLPMQDYRTLRSLQLGDSSNECSSRWGISNRWGRRSESSGGTDVFRKRMVVADG